MSEQPYETFAGQALILRDALALDRTLLANERTLLAWVRTAITLGLAGLTLAHFATGWTALLGLALVPLATLVAGLGLRRHRRMSRAIRRVMPAPMQGG